MAAKEKTCTNLIDGGKYETLYDLPAGTYSDTEVGAIRTKTIRSGALLEIESFPLLRTIAPEARAEKKKRGTSEAQKRLNLRNARKKLQRLAEANFTSADFVLHPTFDYGRFDPGMACIDDIIRDWQAAGFPLDETDARRMIKNYIARIRRLIKRRGGDPKAFKYIYVIESTKEPRHDAPNPLPARYHYHMIIGSMDGMITAKDLADLWQYGYTKAEPLDFRFNGLEGLSTYITKQRSFARRWAHSQNLQDPIITTSDRKISRRRAAMIAADVQANGRQILESIYPDYALESCEVKYSDFVQGAYIYAKLRRRKACGGKIKRGGGKYGKKGDVVRKERNQQGKIRGIEGGGAAV